LAGEFGRIGDLLNVRAGASHALEDRSWASRKHLRERPNPPLQAGNDALCEQYVNNGDAAFAKGESCKAFW
jgi:hypothetical protein